MTSSTTPEGRRYVVINASADHTGGALEPITLYSSDNTALPIPTKQAAQADSTATDVPGLKTDFNALLAKLRLAGILT